MLNERTVDAQGPFLCSHGGITAFCEALRRERFGKQPILWRSAAIVCERKEDVLELRRQIQHELRDIAGPSGVLSGVSIYTLDSLGRNLTQWIHTALDRLETGRDSRQLLFGSLTQNDLRRPFLDVVDQEKLVRHFLLSTGYSGSDTLPLAKQILALIDQPLPEGMTFIDCIRTLEDQFSNAPEEKVWLSSVPHILACLQIARTALAPNRFMRLQSLLDLGFARASDSQMKDMVEALPPVLPALAGALLWLEAPRYTLFESDREDTYSPGNYSAYVSLQLRAVCQTLRSLSLRSEELTIWARTDIRAPSHRLLSQKDSLGQIWAHEGLPQFFRDTEILPELSGDGGSETCFFLRGDLPLEHLRSISPSGAGIYPLSDLDLENYLNRETSKSTGDHDPGVSAELVTQAGSDALDALRDELSIFEEILQKSGHQILETLRSYGLDPNRSTKRERFRILARDLTINVQQPSFDRNVAHPLMRLPQALSFFATPREPERLVIFGRPHSPRSPSFNVRILNQIFAELQKRGATVYQPASDLMYRVFWRSLFFGEKSVDIHLVNAEEARDLEHLLGSHLDVAKRIKSRKTLVASQSSPESNAALLASLQATSPVSGGLPDWQTLRDSIKKINGDSSARVRGRLSMTEFETYCSCPLRFYLNSVAELETRISDPLISDPLEVGTQTHQILEQMTSATKLALGLFPDSIAAHDWLQEFYSDWAERLLKPHTFQCPDGNAFQEAASKSLEKLRSRKGVILNEESEAIFLLLIKEILDSIFTKQPFIIDSNDSAGDAPRQDFAETLFMETKKRLFTRFIYGESQRLEHDRKTGVYRVVSQVEHSVTINLNCQSNSTFPQNHLELVGRIDRIDTVYERTTAQAIRLEIIDYKTSRIRDERKLSLFSIESESSGQTKQSLQGGLYLAALMKQRDRDGLPRIPMVFALYRLGTLKWDENPILLSAEFTDRPEDREILKRGMGILEAKATELMNGNFQPMPQSPSVCEICAFAAQCPRMSSELALEGVGST